MERVAFGTRVRSISIPRVQVAAGMRARAVILDPDPVVKQIAYDDVNKMRVEVTQEQCIASGLTPRANFYMLVARLNTDMKGNIVDSDISVEYLQMSERVYNEFVDTAQEFGSFESVLMVSQTSNGQSQFAYTKPTPSNIQLSQELAEKIEKLKSTAGFIDGCWQLVDQATSMTYERYLTALQNKENQPQAQRTPFNPPRPQLQQSQQKPKAIQHKPEHPKVAPKKVAAPEPQATDEFDPPAEFGNDGISGGDFDDFA